MKILIVGSNSRLVRKIQKSVNNADFVSHKDILEKKIKIKKYQKIFLFSWDKKNLLNNIKLIKALKSKKLVFISSIAVFSLAFRDQWNCYPNHKLICEDFVIKHGGSVIRLGVCDQSLQDKIVGYFGFTLAESLIEFINNRQIKPQTVFNLFECREGGIHGIKKTINNLLLFFSKNLPAKIYFQAPFEIIIKTFLSKSYGYSDDANRIFCDNLVIGNGVLGSTILRNLKCSSCKKNLVIVSGQKNKVLVKNGFCFTKIGKFFSGLSKSWHGVGIRKSLNKYYKFVPLINFRPKAPRFSLLGEVNKINFNHTTLFVEPHNKHIKNFLIYAKKIYLAAGPFENCRILNNSLDKKIKFSFSDHELAQVGYTSFHEASKVFTFKKIGPIFFNRRVIKVCKKNIKFMIDARPYIPYEKSVQMQRFYDSSSSSIIKKIILKFNRYRINEAFYNKFGFSFSTKECALFIQVLAKNCIHKSHQKVLKRRRINIRIKNNIYKILNRKFKTLRLIKHPIFVDAQHVVGGSEFLKNKKIQNALNSKNLIIAGSPTKYQLGPFHHTHDLLELINKQIKKHEDYQFKR